MVSYRKEVFKTAREKRGANTERTERNPHP